MSAFQSFVKGKRRPSDSHNHGSSKKLKYGLEEQVFEKDGTKVADDPTKIGEQFWIVQWRNPQAKKHKTWDGDGVLHLYAGKGVLYDMNGASIASGKPMPDGAAIGTFVRLDNKEMEVDCGLSKADFISKKVFGKHLTEGGPTTLNVVILERKNQVATSNLKKKFSIPFKAVLNNQQTMHQSQTDEQRRKIVELEPVELLQNSPITDSYWSAHWRRPQGKKYKTWDGDSYIKKIGNRITMISEDGKLMGTTTWKGDVFSQGTTFMVSTRTVQIDSMVPKHQVPQIIGSLPLDGPPPDNIDEIEFSTLDEAYNSSTTFDFSGPANKSDTLFAVEKEEVQAKKFVAPTSIYNKPKIASKQPGALHDPNNEGAIIMKAPTQEHQKKFNHKNRPVVPVVIDPILAKHLRPHQKDGVKFMYECVMGLRRHEGQGCILADEMGMGKTLQTITLVWTLLKQNCYGGGGSAVGKALIVCPVSLIANWKKEFHKWLGRDRVGIITGDKDKSTIKLFINSKRHQVLIIGYEKLRSVISELRYCIPPIGLIICDEGHRLKSANNKTSTMFEELSTLRRIILSGTPIQNDLSEFHAMADFCNPGLLDDYSTFRKVFENPILKSRAPGCSAKEHELGEARHTQLQFVAKSFVLRREASILSNYLPPKHEYIVFVTPSILQRSMFLEILKPDTLSSILHGSMARSLAMIQLLTKLSTSPVLLMKGRQKTKMDDDDRSREGQESVQEALKLLPDDASPENVELSGKLFALSRLLKYLRDETEEKCILVSHYTSILDVIEAFCKKKRYTFLRLDGQTPVSKRQEFVDRFNKAPQKGAFLFLLSAKAGGVGLNLIGASRLCLIDSDWNPSHDLQSMARIHRDGQKRPVFIYRFLTAGTIDEKIYQRQVTKLGLSDSLMRNGTGEGEKSRADSFTHKELRDLFTFHSQTSCHTHELLGCLCAYDNETKEIDREDDQVGSDEAPTDSDCENNDDIVSQQHMGFQKASLYSTKNLTKLERDFARNKKAELASLGEWNHLDCLNPSTHKNILDNALRAIAYCPKSLETSIYSISDDEGDSADDSKHKLTDVPGGAICFLFEKTTDKQ